MRLRSIERSLERLVTDGVGRYLPGDLGPAEISRRVVREMADSRSAGVNGDPVVANDFRVSVAVVDLERFGAVRGSLVRELRDLARAVARDEGWEFMGPVRVELDADPGLRAGALRVVARMSEAQDGVGVLHLANGCEVVLGQYVLSLGRLAECTVTFEDPEVSREHAEIRPDGAGYVIIDLGSTNGTTVNGSPIARCRLGDGDRVGLGPSTRFEFRAG